MMESHRNPFSEADRLLVKHRLTIECARLGSSSISDVDVAGRTVPLPELVEALLEGEVISSRALDQSKVFAAWCRSHGLDGLSGILRSLVDVREKAGRGQPVTEGLARLWRLVETRNQGEIFDPHADIEAFLEARRKVAAEG